MSASDIVLEKFYGTKVHYNFSVDKDGNILIGTSQGTFKIIDNSLIKLNDNAGYVRFTKGKLPLYIFLACSDNLPNQMVILLYYGYLNIPS